MFSLADPLSLCALQGGPFLVMCFVFFNYTATTEIYTLSLHDVLPIYGYAHSCGWYYYHGLAAPAYCYDGYYGGYGPVVYGTFGFRDRWGRRHPRAERVIIHRKRCRTTAQSDATPDDLRSRGFLRAPLKAPPQGEGAGLRPRAVLSAQIIVVQAHRPHVGGGRQARAQHRGALVGVGTRHGGGVL